MRSGCRWACRALAARRGVVAQGRRERFAVADIAAAQTLFGRVGVRIASTCGCARRRPGASRRACSPAPRGTRVERPEADVERSGAPPRLPREPQRAGAGGVFTGGLLVFSRRRSRGAGRARKICPAACPGRAAARLVAASAARGPRRSARWARASGLPSLQQPRVVCCAISARSWAVATSGDSRRGDTRLAGALPVLRPRRARRRGGQPRAGPESRGSRACRRTARGRRGPCLRSACQRAWPGLTGDLAGAALTQVGPVRGLPLFGYVAIALLLVGP